MRRGQSTNLTSFYLQTTCQSSQRKSDESHERFDRWPTETQCGPDKEPFVHSMTQISIHQISLMSDDKTKKTPNLTFSEIMFQHLPCWQCWSNTFELWEHQSHVYRSYLPKWFCAIAPSVMRSETFRRKQLPVIVETSRADSVTCKTQSNSKPVVSSQPGDRVKLCTDGLCLLKAKRVHRFESVTTSILKMERFDLWLWLFNSPALYWWFKWVTEL